MPSFDDTAVPALAQLRQLKRLELVGTSISAQGLARLRQALPNKTVTTPPPS